MALAELRAGPRHPPGQLVTSIAPGDTYRGDGGSRGKVEGTF